MIGYRRYHVKTQRTQYMLATFLPKLTLGSLYRNILAGSYDANVRIFDASRNPIHTITGHTAPVTSVCWVGEERLVASASHDRTVRLVRVPEAHDGAPTTLASLHLHISPVSSVASNRRGTCLLTASWDTFIGVWSTSIPDTDEVSAEHVTEDRKKRRKVAEATRPVRKVCGRSGMRLCELIVFERGPNMS